MRTTRTTTRLLAALAATAALVVAGCGGEEEADDTTTTAEDASADTTESTTTTEASSDDGSGDGGGSTAGAFTSEECQQLADAFDESQLGAFTSGTDPTPELEETAQFLTEAAAQAPDEVADDIGVMAEVYRELARAASDVDWDALASGDPSAIAAATQLSQVYVDNPDFGEAAGNLATWTADNCTPAGIGG